LTVHEMLQPLAASVLIDQVAVVTILTVRQRY
jgi:hypothetical protein